MFGDYTVSVTMDGSVCDPVIETLSIGQPTESLSGTITQLENTECIGEDTGSLTAQGIGGTPPYTYSIDNGVTYQTDGLFENLGAGTYTVLITDANLCTYNITNILIEIDDSESPTIMIPNTLTFEGCDANTIDALTAVFPYSDIQSADVQAIFASNSDYNASDDFNIFSITYIDTITSTDNCPILVNRTFSVTDNCGNTSTATQIITVQDTTAPTFTVPADITIECDIDATDVSLTGDVTDENDGCSTTLEATFTDSIVDGDCPNESTITRTWSLADACGNTTMFNQTITVQDTTAPVFNEALPPDTTTECDAVPTAETLTATDNCGTAEVTFEEEIMEGSCIGDYIIVRTWTTIDSCDNEAVHTQIINVEDNNAPTLVTPIDTILTVQCDSIPEIPNLVFQDTCSNNIDVVFNEDSSQLSYDEDYVITRTWTVEDDCGNQAVFTQIINVEMSNVIYASDTSRCILDEEFDLFDLLSGDFDMNGSWSVVSGNASINGSLFDPSSVDVGIYTFMYSITDGPCPADKKVSVTLDDDCVVIACGEDDVVVSKTVTDNGDGYNDFFTITGVEDCEFIIELQIFNRWGAEIYKSTNYKNDWNGFSHDSSVGNSGKVPTGTYYYIINITNSGIAPFTGPIYVATN